MVLFGWLTVVLAMTPRISSRPIQTAVSLVGSTWIRTACFYTPPILTKPTSGISEICCIRILSAEVIYLNQRQSIRLYQHHNDKRVGRIHFAEGRLDRQVDRQLAVGGGDRRLHGLRSSATSMQSAKTATPAAVQHWTPWFLGCRPAD